MRCKHRVVGNHSIISPVPLCKPNFLIDIGFLVDAPRMNWPHRTVAGSESHALSCSEGYVAMHADRKFELE